MLSVFWGLIFPHGTGWVDLDAQICPRRIPDASRTTPGTLSKNYKFSTGPLGVSGASLRAPGAPSKNSKFSMGSRGHFSSHLVCISEGPWDPIDQAD